MGFDKPEITRDNYELEIEKFFLSYVKLFAISIKNYIVENGKPFSHYAGSLSTSFYNYAGVEGRYDGEIYMYYELNKRFDEIYEFLNSESDLHYRDYVGNKIYTFSMLGNKRCMLFPIATVVTTKPCEFNITDQFKLMLKVLEEELDQYDIKVGKPYLKVDEACEVRFTLEEKSFPREFEGLRCTGCKHRAGFFSRYSDYICHRGLWVDFSKK